MELSNEFVVGLPVIGTWEVLTDVERIAPCLPGAELREVDGDDYKGIVKVKVGPISVQYQGLAHFVEKDDSSHRAVLRAQGRETRGQGNANATITAVLEPSGDATRVSLTTDLQITGKVAQFGRGVLADVSTKLLEQFVENLERTVLNVAHAPGGPDSAVDLREPGAAWPGQDAKRAPAAAQDGAPRRIIESPKAEPVDLWRVAGKPISRRVLPVVGGVLAILAAIAVIRRLLRD